MKLKTDSMKNKTTTVLFLLLALLLCCASASTSSHTDGTERAWLTLISTTDLHGNIAPLDYYTNKPDARGLAKAATIIAQIRKENPNSLLLDSGDTIQGTPLVYYHNKINNTPIDPMMLAMNTLRYDAMTVGNHEYNFGLKVLEKARSEAKFPWLSANTYRVGTNETAYQPYLIKEINGVRVGVLGLTTPGIPNWENKENYEGLEFRETVGEARKWVKVLREKERVDLVVIAMHMGLEEDLRTGEVNPSNVPNENAAVKIARQVAGVDVILMGHTHREVPAVVINGTLLTQADYWGHRLARVDLYLEKTEQNGGRWRVVAKSARTIPVDNVQPDDEISKIAEPYNR